MVEKNCNPALRQNLCLKPDLRNVAELRLRFGSGSVPISDEKAKHSERKFYLLNWRTHCTLIGVVHKTKKC